MTVSSVSPLSNTSPSSAPAGFPQPYAQYYGAVTRAARETGIPASVLFGVMRRETNGRNIDGDGGHGHGLFQVDDRSWRGWLAQNHNGHDPYTAAKFAGNLIQQNLRTFHGNMRAALAAYNCGPGNVNPSNPDARTTGHNYSASVLSYAQAFQRFMGPNTSLNQAAAGIPEATVAAPSTPRTGGPSASTTGSYSLAEPRPPSNLHALTAEDPVLKELQSEGADAMIQQLAKNPTSKGLSTAQLTQVLLELVANQLAQLPEFQNVSQASVGKVAKQVIHKAHKTHKAHKVGHKQGDAFTAPTKAPVDLTPLLEQLKVTGASPELVSKLNAARASVHASA